MARDSDARTVVGLPSLLQVQLPVVTSPQDLLPGHCTRKWCLSVEALSLPEHIPRSACLARMCCHRARARSHAHESLDLQLSAALQPPPDAAFCALKMTVTAGSVCVWSSPMRVPAPRVYSACVRRGSCRFSNFFSRDDSDRWLGRSSHSTRHTHYTQELRDGPRRIERPQSDAHTCGAV